MVETSIQYCGTATTTSAKPKPSGLIRCMRPSSSGAASRSRSSPVMPRCTSPASSDAAISAADSSITSMSGKPAKRGAIAARARRLLQRHAGIGETGVAACPAGGPWTEWRASECAITPPPARCAPPARARCGWRSRWRGPGVFGAQRLQQRVIAAAARDLHRAFRVARPQLEHKAGVIFHVAAETGGEAARAQDRRPAI